MEIKKTTTLINVDKKKPHSLKAVFPSIYTEILGLKAGDKINWTLNEKEEITIKIEKQEK